MQFTVIISLDVCGQTQEVNEIMRQTLIHGARHSSESESVALHEIASTAQTFTVLAPSEV